MPISTMPVSSRPEPELVAAAPIAHADTASAMSTSKSITSGHIVIIGAGMAGSRLAIQLATACQHTELTNAVNMTSATCITPKITLISKEPEVGYNRIMLSPVLAGETAFADTYLYDKADYARLGIQVLAGVGVDGIDTDQQLLQLDNHQTLHYDKLVVATGSTARVIPFPNHDSKGVHVFRDVADVAVLTDYAKQGKTGLVIGGGVLGLEAACALAVQGAKMTVVHVDGYVLNRQLDLPAALLLQEELARRNVGLEVSAATTQIEKNAAGEVIGLSLKDGRTLPADFIVMAVGIVPNTKLASASGILVKRGVVVDEFMHSDCANVYAIGECIEINEELFGMVSSINQHVETLISVLTQPNSPESWQPFVSVPLSLKLKVSGIAVFSAGQIEFDNAAITEAAAEKVEKILYHQTSSQHHSDQYQCLYLQGNRLIGVVLYGETSEGNFYSQLINQQTDISSCRDNLIYGAAYCELEPHENDETVNLVTPTIMIEASSAQTKVADNIKQELSRGAAQTDAAETDAETDATETDAA